MKIVRSSKELIQVLADSHSGQDRVGLVPTMGYLHYGHISLIERCSYENDLTVLSVFVNSKQFNLEDDFELYPRDEASDIKIAQQSGVDLMWLPSVADIYPPGDAFMIEEDGFSREMEGVARPGHFSGVLTVVMKLLQQVRPHRVYFGEKDYQQYELIKGMVASFCMPVEVISCPTVRAESGLALSSRNARLSDANQRRAAGIYQTMRRHAAADLVRDDLRSQGFAVDYVEDYNGRRYVAAWLAGVRLIDNLDLAILEAEAC